MTDFQLNQLTQQEDDWSESQPTDQPIMGKCNFACGVKNCGKQFKGKKKADAHDLFLKHFSEVHQDLHQDDKNCNDKYIIKNFLKKQQKLNYYCKICKELGEDQRFSQVNNVKDRSGLEPHVKHKHPELFTDEYQVRLQQENSNKWREQWCGYSGPQKTTVGRPNNNYIPSKYGSSQQDIEDDNNITAEDEAFYKSIGIDVRKNRSIEGKEYKQYLDIIEDLFKKKDDIEKQQKKLFGTQQLMIPQPDSQMIINLGSIEFQNYLSYDSQQRFSNLCYLIINQKTPDMKKTDGSLYPVVQLLMEQIHMYQDTNIYNGRFAAMCIVGEELFLVSTWNGYLKLYDTKFRKDKNFQDTLSFYNDEDDSQQCVKFNNRCILSMFYDQKSDSLYCGISNGTVMKIQTLIKNKDLSERFREENYYNIETSSIENAICGLHLFQNQENQNLMVTCQLNGKLQLYDEENYSSIQFNFQNDKIVVACHFQKVGDDFYIVLAFDQGELLFLDQYLIEGYLQGQYQNQLIDAQDVHEQHTKNTRIRTIKISPDGKNVVLGMTDGKLLIYDIQVTDQKQKTNILKYNLQLSKVVQNHINRSNNVPYSIESIDEVYIEILNLQTMQQNKLKCTKDYVLTSQFLGDFVVAILSQQKQTELLSSEKEEQVQYKIKTIQAGKIEPKLLKQ